MRSHQHKIFIGHVLIAPLMLVRYVIFAFCDGSLAAASIDCEDASAAIRCKWPYVPRQILGLKGGQVVVCGDASTDFCILELSETMPLTSPSMKLSAKKSERVLASCTNGVSLYSLLECADKSVYLARVDCIPGSQVPIVELVGNTPINLSSESIVSIVGHAHCAAISVVLAADASASGRWLKFDTQGVLLHEAILDFKPYSASTTESPSGEIATNGHLWLFGDGLATVWDTNFCRQLHRIATPSSGRTTSAAIVATTTASSFGQSTVFYHCTGTADETGKQKKGSSSLRHCRLVKSLVEIKQSSLSSLIGPSCHDAAVECGDGRVLASMSSSDRKKFARAQKALEDHRRGSLQDHTIDVDAKKQRPDEHPRKRKFYLDLPLETCNEFLGRIEAVCRTGSESGPQPNDWATLLTLLSSETVSLKSYPSILSSAVSRARWDVVLSIARYGVDLTEREALELIQDCLCVKESQLENWVMEGSAVVWKGRDDLKRGSKKPKGNNSTNEPHETKMSSIAGIVATTPLALTIAVLRAVFRRPFAFTSVLLTESLRTIVSTDVAVTLLRLIVSLLQNDSDGETNDSMLGQAVVWMQCLVDAHFSAIAFNARLERTHKALMCTMQLVHQYNAQETSREVEQALGFWLHVSRLSKLGARPVDPPSALYSVEKLLF